LTFDWNVQTGTYVLILCTIWWITYSFYFF